MTRTRWIQATLVVAGVVMGLLAYRVQVDNLPLTTSARSFASVAAAWAFLGAGTFAWIRRPGNRLGPLMIAVCFALLVRQFRYSHDDFVFTVCFLLGELGYAFYAHVALAYPTGRVTDRVEKWFLKFAYAVALVFPLVILLFYDSSHRLRYFDPSRRESLILVSGNPGAVDALQKAFAFTAYGAMAVLLIVLIGRKLYVASLRARRILAPLLLAAVVAALWAVLNSILTFTTLPPGIAYDLFWWQIVGLIALPIALLWGLLRARLARVQVSDLVVHLEQTPVDGLRGELAAALGDQSLELGLWIPERHEYVDASGISFAVPEDGPDRAVTRIEHEGAPL